jgi:hypothetical protein
MDKENPELAELLSGRDDPIVTKFNAESENSRQANP